MGSEPSRTHPSIFLRSGLLLNHRSGFSNNGLLLNHLLHRFASATTLVVVKWFEFKLTVAVSWNCAFGHIGMVRLQYHLCIQFLGNVLGCLKLLRGQCLDTSYVVTWFSLCVGPGDVSLDNLSHSSTSTNSAQPSAIISTVPLLERDATIHIPWWKTSHLAKIHLHILNVGNVNSSLSNSTKCTSGIIIGA